MKIRDPGRRLPLERPIPAEKQRLLIKGSRAKQPSGFQQELFDSQKRQFSNKLKNLLEDIDSEGQRLIKLRTLDVLLQYKELIKTFIKEVVQNLYLIKEESHFDPKGKHRVLVLVKTINKTLEDLVKMVLDKEVNNLRLLEKVGEIKGMLIDLYS